MVSIGSPGAVNPMILTPAIGESVAEAVILSTQRGRREKQHDIHAGKGSVL